VIEKNAQLNRLSEVSNQSASELSTDDTGYRFDLTIHMGFA